MPDFSSFCFFGFFCLFPDFLLPSRLARGEGVTLDEDDDVGGRRGVFLPRLLLLPLVVFKGMLELSGAAHFLSARCSDWQGRRWLGR
jgi:hypothetical protein